MEDQRRRTQEGLDRRFAQAAAEVRTKHQIREKRAASVNESSPLTKTPKTPFTNASSRKGNISFSGHASKQDVEVNGPAYSKLSFPVNDNLLPNSIEVSDGKTTVDRILHELFQHGDSAQKYMQGSKSIKIERNILLDNHYVKKSGMLTAGHNRTLHKGAKRSKKHMSLKEHKKSGLFDLPRVFHKYDILKPVHHRWKLYSQLRLERLGEDQLARWFLEADLHGAVILVVQCKITAFVGIHGIVIRETAKTFGIITKDDKFRVVPKQHSVFVLQADRWKVTLHGDKFISRDLAS